TVQYTLQTAEEPLPPGIGSGQHLHCQEEFISGNAASLRIHSIRALAVDEVLLDPVDAFRDVPALDEATDLGLRSAGSRATVDGGLRRAGVRVGCCRPHPGGFELP